MRSLLVIVLVGGLAFQSALAGPWGRREPPQRPGRPPPRMQPQRPPPPFAQRPAPAPQAQAPQAMQRSLSGNEAAHRAQQINGGGRVLAVDPAETGYRVRVLKDGEVRSVYVPDR